MRPPEFTGGNRAVCGRQIAANQQASMRPPEFTGGNPRNATFPPAVADASMRPPEFTGGNTIG